MLLILVSSTCMVNVSAKGFGYNLIDLLLFSTSPIPKFVQPGVMLTVTTKEVKAPFVVSNLPSVIAPVLTFAATLLQTIVPLNSE